MLTRAQIQRLAQRNGIGLQAQERDYVQHLLLFRLYRRTQALIFKGGTALRVVHRGNRYSEDLDFNGPADMPALQKSWGEEVSTRRVLVTPEYDNLRPFVVIVLSAEHLFAEKVRALLVRGKPRDLYDLWLLHAQGVRAEAENELIQRKLALYDLALTPKVVEEAFRRAAADWERDLRPLLPQFIPWQDTAPLVEDLLELLQATHR